MHKSVKKIYYNPKLKILARSLRNNSTLSEVLLWEHLKGKQMKGYDFHRQKPIDNYIIDFYCNRLMLVIEIDGDSHDFEDVALNDEIRQERLQALGLTFLRFDDLDVKQDIETVLFEIESWIEEWELKNKKGNS